MGEGRAKPIEDGGGGIERARRVFGREPARLCPHAARFLQRVIGLIAVGFCLELALAPPFCFAATRILIVSEGSASLLAAGNAENRPAPQDAATVAGEIGIIAFASSDSPLFAAARKGAAGEYPMSRSVWIGPSPGDPVRSPRSQIVTAMRDAAPAMGEDDPPRSRTMVSDQGDDFPFTNTRMGASVMSRAPTTLKPAFATRLPMAAAATMAMLLTLALVPIRWLRGAGAPRRAAIATMPAGPQVLSMSPLAMDADSRDSEGGGGRPAKPAMPSFARPGVGPGEVQESLRALADRIMASAARRVVVGMAKATSKARPLVAVALARQLSRRGARVLLVDFNTDGANGAAMVPHGEKPADLADLLAGDISFAQAIFGDRSSRAHIIAGGSRPLPADEEAEQRIETVLDALDATYDHVILDADHLMALKLAPKSASIVLVAETSQTEPAVLQARARLAEVGAGEIMVLVAAPSPGEGERWDEDPDTVVA